jgi:protein-S-isoprenylcysteine O-methyltransferase Ste14
MHGLRVVLINGVLSVAVIALAWLGLRADVLWPFALPAEVVYAGWPLMAVGGMLILAAEATFLRVSHATGATGDPPSRLVTGGPFRWLRNPIYLGAGMVFFGLAFSRRSPTLGIAALAMAAVMGAYVRWFEEPRLERRFGEEYRRYRASVPRWIPRIGKRNRA